MTPSQREIKDCPFCGEIPILYKNSNYPKGYIKHSSKNKFTTNETICILDGFVCNLDKWNRRKGDKNE